jgi:hypothetical protein
LRDLTDLTLATFKYGEKADEGIGSGLMFKSALCTVPGFTFQASIPLAKATVLARAIAHLFITVRQPPVTIKDEHANHHGLSSVGLPMVLPARTPGAIRVKTMPPSWHSPADHLLCNDDGDQDRPIDFEDCSQCRGSVIKKVLKSMTLAQT